MKTLNMMLAAGALAVSAGTASAATYYATSIDATYGTCSYTGNPAMEAYCSSDDRLNEANALGETDGKFYSLGHGGTAILGFAKSLFPAGTVSAFEITFNRLIGHDEAVRVETLDSALNVVEDLGSLTNLPGSGSIWASLPFSYIKLTDITLSLFPASTSFDGFDVDSVGIAPVPLPAAGLMLLAGLGGFATLRRRKTAA